MTGFENHLESMQNLFLNIAYAGIGLDAYWPQVPGLKEKLGADMASTLPNSPGRA
jgi:hypothetical protein